MSTDVSRNSRLSLKAASCVLSIFPCAAFAGDYIFSDDFTDPGPGPTQMCSVLPNSDGFFTMSGDVVRLPPKYEVANPRPSRLLIALHGCGDSAANFATWAAAPFSVRSSQDYIAVAVGGRDGQCWDTNHDATLVAATIARVSSCFYVHQERIVLGGYSSGGDLAYKLAMTDSLVYSGVLIEHSGLFDVVGSANVDNVLAAAEWKINIGHTAGINDPVYLISNVRSDYNKMVAHGFPIHYQETSEDHDGTSDDWAGFLIPLMAKWSTP
jgi:predicted esterase